MVAFDPIGDGELQAGEPMELPSAEAAKRRAASISRAYVGVVAFSRTVDPATSEFEHAGILSEADAVDLNTC